MEIRRRIAILPESPGLYLRMSVIENLECFAHLYEVPSPGERIERALAGRQPGRRGPGFDAPGVGGSGRRRSIGTSSTAREAGAGNRDHET